MLFSLFVFLEYCAWFTLAFNGLLKVYEVRHYFLKSFGFSIISALIVLIIAPHGIFVYLVLPILMLSFTDNPIIETGDSHSFFLSNRQMFAINMQLLLFITLMFDFIFCTMTVDIPLLISKFPRLIIPSEFFLIIFSIVLPISTFNSLYKAGNSFIFGVLCLSSIFSGLLVLVRNTGMNIIDLIEFHDSWMPHSAISILDLFGVLCIIRTIAIVKRLFNWYLNLKEEEAKSMAL